MLISFRKILLLTLLCILPNSIIVQAFQSSSENNVTGAQQEKKQEKSTWRNKVIKWGSIITGVAASVAISAGLYFKLRNKKTTDEKALKESQTNSSRSQEVANKNEPQKEYMTEEKRQAIRKEINETYSLEELNKIDQTLRHNSSLKPAVQNRQKYITKMKNAMLKLIDDAHNFDDLSAVIGSAHSNNVNKQFWYRNQDVQNKFAEQRDKLVKERLLSRYYIQDMLTAMSFYANKSEFSQFLNKPGNEQIKLNVESKAKDHGSSVDLFMEDAGLE